MVTRGYASNSLLKCGYTFSYAWLRIGYATHF